MNKKLKPMKWEMRTMKWEIGYIESERIKETKKEKYYFSPPFIHLINSETLS